MKSELVLTLSLSVALISPKFVFLSVNDGLKVKVPSMLFVLPSPLLIFVFFFKDLKNFYMYEYFVCVCVCAVHMEARKYWIL